MNTNMSTSTGRNRSPDYHGDTLHKDMSGPTSAYSGGQEMSEKPPVSDLRTRNFLSVGSPQELEVLTVTGVVFEKKMAFLHIPCICIIMI